jgi:hypothetical protein
VLAGEHMWTIAGSGRNKADIWSFLFEHTQNNHAHLKRWPAPRPPCWDRSPTLRVPARSRASGSPVGATFKDDFGPYEAHISIVR